MSLLVTMLTFLLILLNNLKPGRRKKVGKSEKKKDEGKAAEAPRKHPSNSSFLDYVVVSDTLSGLDAGDKRADLIQMMMPH
ncbi:hypothetical protein Hanom_Chr12g01095931 [Helianthus anomalus]